MKTDANVIDAEFGAVDDANTTTLETPKRGFFSKAGGVLVRVGPWLLAATGLALAGVNRRTLRSLQGAGEEFKAAIAANVEAYLSASENLLALRGELADAQVLLKGLCDAAEAGAIPVETADLAQKQVAKLAGMVRKAENDVATIESAVGRTIAAAEAMEAAEAEAEAAPKKGKGKGKGK